METNDLNTIFVERIRLQTNIELGKLKQTLKVNIKSKTLKVKRDVLLLEPANQRFVLNPASISI